MNLQLKAISQKILPHPLDILFRSSCGNIRDHIVKFRPKPVRAGDPVKIQVVGFVQKSNERLAPVDDVCWIGSAGTAAHRGGARRVIGDTPNGSNFKTRAGRFLAKRYSRSKYKTQKGRAVPHRQFRK